MLPEERLDKVEKDVHDIQNEMGKWHGQIAALTDRVDDIAQSLKEINAVFKRIEGFAKGFFAYSKHALKWFLGILGGGLAAALGTYLITHFAGK